MKIRLHLLIELVLIVLLSVVFPKASSIQSIDAAPVQIVGVEIEEQEEVDRDEHYSNGKSDSIDNDGGKKFKPVSTFQERNQLNFIPERLIGRTHIASNRFCSKSPRYILYCSLIVYAELV
jgi:hypothetical protein